MEVGLTSAKAREDNSGYLRMEASQGWPVAEQSVERGACYICKSPLHRKANCPNADYAVKQRDSLRQNNQKPAFIGKRTMESLHERDIVPLFIENSDLTFIA